MELRDLPDGLNDIARCEERRVRIERALDMDLSPVRVREDGLGNAEQVNCEQMFGHVPVPLGMAGPLRCTLSNDKNTIVHLPLATTEGALVASVNRGCKALTQSNSLMTNSVLKGVSRSICLKVPAGGVQSSLAFIEAKYELWKDVAEHTSNHLNILTYSLAFEQEYVYLTVSADTDEAMGMNMITIAMQAVGQWLEKHIDGARLVTVAANVDSDKKPSVRTRDLGRGHMVEARADLTEEIIATVLKSTPEAMLEVAEAKLVHGSMLAQAVGANLQAANVVAALYIATGQDPAHVVEGSLATTKVVENDVGLHISVELPAVLVGVRGGGTSLPAQSRCLDMLSDDDDDLHPVRRLAEIVGAAVLAGETSLLAAQASHRLASAHRDLAREKPKI